MRRALKIIIIIALANAIALSTYAIATHLPQDTRVYRNVKITDIKLQNWGSDFVYLSNGAVLRIQRADGLMIGHSYDVYQSWMGNYHFKLLD